MQENRFDSSTHTYYISGKAVPGVTEIIHSVLGNPYKGIDPSHCEWYMQRGTAIHACCALIARGVEFTYDSRIEGQVSACRKFFEDYNPEPIEIETPHYSNTFGYAGTPDLVCRINGRRVVIDYKGSLTPEIELQLGGYGELVDCNYGIGVQLKADGSYQPTDLFDLRKARREFLHLLTAYRWLKRLGRLERHRPAHQTKQEVACQKH